MAAAPALRNAVLPLCFLFLSRAAAAPEGYALAWSDEFDGHALNRARWEYRLPGGREGTVVSPEAAALDGEGHLVLTTFLREGRLHVGMVGTQPTFQARYGYFEARIRFQSLQGHHGAFWLQSPEYGRFPGDPGRSGAEIDVIEYFGAGRDDGGGGMRVYWNPYPSPSAAGVKISIPDAHERFRVYALHWTEQGYRFYIDGELRFETAEGLSHACQYLVLSLLSSPWERGRLATAALPDAMTVDYVRVYARPGPRAPCS